MSSIIRIFVVHQTGLIANIIASAISGESDIEVVGKATTVDEALVRLRTSDCNIILVSARLPNQGALKLTEAMVEIDPAKKVLVIGLPESDSLILQYVMAGAAGYVLQDVPVDGLLDNVRAAHDDQALVSPSVAAKLMTHITELAQISMQNDVNPAVVEELTPREREVLELIGDGLTNQEISERLYIEVGTVKNHVHNLLKKLDVSSREDAAGFLPYIQEGEPDESQDL